MRTAIPDIFRISMPAIYVEEKMPVQLSHLGEDLIAEMLQTIAVRRQLNEVKCAISGRSLAQDVAEFGLGDTPAFKAEDATLSVHNGGCRYACDGEQRIDVICTGNDHAIAFEAKLGETRMATAEFRRRFCTQCEKSKHTDCRLSGSMIAVLERSFPFAANSDLFAHLGQTRWSLVRPWWLVVRKSVLTKWQKASEFPTQAARILTFDALAELYGSVQEFDRMVTNVVGSSFSTRWSIEWGAKSGPCGRKFGVSGQ